MVRPATLTDEEEARAAELEAQIVAAEKLAEKTAETEQRRARTRRDGGEGVSVMHGTIAMRAAEEYRYVARDMRRILIIGGGLTLFLLVFWLVASLAGISVI